MVEVRVANVSQAVLIGVELVRIGDQRAIIRLVGNAIAIRVFRRDSLAGPVAGGIVGIVDDIAVTVIALDQPVEFVVFMGNLFGMNQRGNSQYSGKY